MGILLDVSPPFGNQTVGPTIGPQEIGRVSVVAPATVGECGAIEYLDGLNGDGGPPLSNVIIVDGTSLQGFPQIGGVVCAVGTPFVRSDCNDDAVTNIADAVFVLAYLFQSGATPNCLEACDGNGDDTVDLADGLFIANYLFTNGPMPPSPFPDCGVGSGVLGCDSFGGC